MRQGFDLGLLTCLSGHLHSHCGNPRAHAEARPQRGDHGWGPFRRKVEACLSCPVDMERKPPVSHAEAAQQGANPDSMGVR